MEKALLIIFSFILSSKPKELYSSQVPLVLHDDYYAKQEVIISDEQVDLSEPVFESSIETNYQEESNEISKENTTLVNESIKIDNDTELVGVEPDSNTSDNNVTSDYNDEVVSDVVSLEADNSNIFVDSTEVINSQLEDNKESIVTTLDEIPEVKTGYYSPNGTYLGDKNVKVVDVSYYQKDVDWDLFASKSDCYGVILRLGYYETLDKKFERNISELKRLNIPYGIYLYSYSVNKEDAIKEANFTINMIDKYDISPLLGIYYDIESWSRKDKKSSSISKDMYDIIITTYIDMVSNHVADKYKVKVYSGRWYAMNKFNSIGKSYVDWVAEYNKTCKYDDNYSMWQFTSKGKVPGINGNVDISYIL